MLTLLVVYIILLCSDKILTMEYKTVLNEWGARATISKKCPTCYGMGYTPFDFQDCKKCGGSGEIFRARRIPSIRHRDIQGVVEA